MQRVPVVRGLAENPAMPVDVLARLLRDWPKPVASGLSVRAALPVSLQQQMVAHESRQVRCALARREVLDPAVLAQLLRDPDLWVRMTFFTTKRRQQPPEAALMRLMTELVDPSADRLATPDELFEELFFANWNQILVAARHPDPRVRRFPAGHAEHKDLRFLLADPEPQVAAAAAEAVAEHERLREPADLPHQHCHAFWWVLHHPLSGALAEQVATSGDIEAITSIAGNPTLPPHIAEFLSHHPQSTVRATIAYRPDLDDALVAALAADPDPTVRATIATHAGLTSEQIAAFTADPDDSVRVAVATHAYVSPGQRSILDGHADLPLDAAEQWAHSTNPRLRRRAAQHPDLPPEIVDLLTNDPDASVRTDLALNHAGAPGALLLDCYLDDRHRPRLLALPGFPRAGLSRFADHADPDVRILAARDPETDPAVIDHLTTDPVAWVRKTMARCPRLSTDRIAALLDDAELATDAAANPSLDWQPVVRALETALGS
jgi:hypothetical protein